MNPFHAARYPFVWLLKGYRLVISPLYGNVCKYYPSCSQYAVDAFETHGVFRGFALTAWRLLRCNPFSTGGVDYVPGSDRERTGMKIAAMNDSSLPTLTDVAGPDPRGA